MPDPACDRLAAAARGAGVVLVVGVNAREGCCFVLGVAPVMRPDRLPDSVVVGPLPAEP